MSNIDKIDYISQGEEEKKQIINTTKEKLKEIDIAESITAQEQLSQDNPIDSFLLELEKYDEQSKIQLLYDVLKVWAIKVGFGDKNGNDTKPIMEIIDDFSKFFKQEWNSWKLEINWTLPKGKEYLDEFKNQKNSSLAYLIQRTANFVNIEAARGYGVNTRLVERIAEDRALWNQTHRALLQLKDWVTGEKNTMNVKSEKLNEYEEIDIENMQRITKDFVKELFEKNRNLAEQYWKIDDNWNISPADGKEKVYEWSNNYVVKDIENIKKTDNTKGTGDTERTGDTKGTGDTEGTGSSKIWIDQETEWWKERTILTNKKEKVERNECLKESIQQINQTQTKELELISTKYKNSFSIKSWENISEITLTNENGNTPEKVDELTSIYIIYNKDQIELKKDKKDTPEIFIRKAINLSNFLNKSFYRLNEIWLQNFEQFSINKNRNTLQIEYKENDKSKKEDLFSSVNYYTKDTKSISKYLNNLVSSD